MKLYQYDDLKKTNQALGSFKRNEVPVEKVELVVIEGKVQFFIVADPPYTPRPEGDKPKKKVEKEPKADKEPKAKEKKVEKKDEEKKEEKKPKKKEETKKEEKKK